MVRRLPVSPRRRRAIFQQLTLRSAAVMSAALLSVGAVLVPAQRALALSASNGAACTIVGTAHADVLIGTWHRDVICGLGGDDTIHGLSGNDILDGGTGDDTLIGGTGADTFIGGTGEDTASYADHTTAVSASLDAVANAGSAGERDKIETDVENLVGGRGNDTLAGNDAPNTLNGGRGNDMLSGGAGNDALSGGSGADLLSGDAGDDTLNGGTGTDQLSGGTDGDALDGGGSIGGEDQCDHDSLDSVHNCAYDGVGPKVLSISYGRRTIDTSSADQVVDVRITAWDASGVAIDGTAPGNSSANLAPDVFFMQASPLAHFDSMDPGYLSLSDVNEPRTCSTDAQDPHATLVHLVCPVTFPKGLPTGSWEAYARLNDPIGNYSDNPRPSTFPLVRQVGAGRSTVPDLEHVAISATPWDTNSDSATVTVDVWLNGANGCLSDPSLPACLTAPSRITFGGDGGWRYNGYPQLVAVDDAGHYSITATALTQGQWTVAGLYMYSGGSWGPQFVRDNVPGSFGTTSVQIGTSLPNAPAPALTSISVAPDTIDTALGDQTVTVTAELTNATRMTAVLNSPDYTMRVAGVPLRVSGDDSDGVWTETFTVPAHTGAGSWEFWVFLSDDAPGTAPSYTVLIGCDLAALGATGYVVNHQASRSCP